MSASSSADERSVLFEQYKLAVEMADRVSARRGTANAFFFTVTSALLATAESLTLPLASSLGLVLVVAWWFLLRSYRKLNAAKFEIIGKLEDHLPVRIFGDEWDILKQQDLEQSLVRSRFLSWLTKPASRYAELSLVEQVVPIVFAILYLISLVDAVT